MQKLTDKERLDRQLGKHKPVKHEDARLPLRARVLGNNYGPSSSYTPASDYTPPCAPADPAPADTSPSFDGGGGSFDGGGASGDY